MKNLTPAPAWLTSLPIAHRAFHDLKAGKPENSIAAFKAAMEAGFAIECDLQGTKNHEPVVFHDPTLERLTDHSGHVKDFLPSELGKMHLTKSDETIATLEQHLELVNGKVPLILECKAQVDREEPVMEAVARALENYKGPVCLMSFNHKMCSYFKPLMPHIPRGLTAEGGNEDHEKHLHAMIEYDLQFVSYHVTELPNHFCEGMRESGIPLITWTVRDATGREITNKYADQMTFEGIDPRDFV